jgi:hypothetical protein
VRFQVPAIPTLYKWSAVSWNINFECTR